MDTKIAVVCRNKEYEAEAVKLAEKLTAPVFFSEEELIRYGSADPSDGEAANGKPRSAETSDGKPADRKTAKRELSEGERPGKNLPYTVRFEEDGVSLWGDGLSYRGDYSAMAGRLKHNNLTHELLVKASRLKDRASAEPPLAIDATAGMGEDSLLLAAAGFRVLLIEKDPIIAALLKDTLRRASIIPGLEDVVLRMQVCEGDSKEVLKAVSEYAEDFVSPDVIYLDPMFPEKTKNSLTKKKFQLIHCLESPCTDENELLEAALSCGAKRVVIKRPLKGPFLGGVKPSYSLTGKTVRYDCLVGK